MTRQAPRRRFAETPYEIISPSEMKLASKNDPIIPYFWQGTLYIVRGSQSRATFLLIRDGLHGDTANLLLGP